MSITFYYSPMSSSSRVHWALEELGIPYEAVRVNLAAGEQRKPEFLAINPNGKVPAIVIDGVPMFESLAILTYLGEQYGVEKGLYPPPGPQRAEALKWMFWGGVTLTEAAFRMMRHTSERFPAEERNEKAGESAKKDMHRLLGILDRALEGREYLIGDHFNLADLALGSQIGFYARVGGDLSDFQNLRTWSARCLSRPAMARVPN